MKVIAILAAYNEADIVAEVVRALVDDGAQVYVLDNHSTDDTVARLSAFRGRGVINIETFPAEAGTGASDGFAWERILRRKEELAWELDADWFIHHDADEFRESPWDAETLVDGIARADAAGYNAIDFQVLNFWPTEADPPQAPGIRERLRFYEPGQVFDRLQVKCWKKTDVRVDLASSGGHDVQFPVRHIFPIRFLLRHYPIRSDAHAERKIHRERLPRFLPEERARGWHVQYDAVTPGASFVREAASLVRYDPAAVRLSLFLRHRGVELLERVASANETLADRLADDLAPTRQQLERLQRHLVEQDSELDRLRPERERLLGELAWFRRMTAPWRAATRLWRK